MRELRLSEIAALFGAGLKYDAGITRVVTDSREAAPGALFVAIKGERLNGNSFAASALEKGAEAVVVSELFEGVDPDKAILVPDGKKALIKIGGLHRSRFNIPFVGVTGSVGKTTTKEFIAAVLSAKYIVHKNQGNQNNEIGVPNTLFSLDDSHEVAVIEMGMSGMGEIHDLAVEVKPSAAVITCIGVSHLEFLGSRENILKAKMEITDGMADDSLLLLCGDDDMLNTVSDNRLNIMRYGIKNTDCQIRALDITQKGAATEFTIISPWGEHSASIPLVGKHNVLDALAAFSVGCVMGVEPASAAKALSGYVAVGMRQNVIMHKGVTLVGDCYNCSPDSLRAAALALASFPCEGRRIMVLSDMLELGEAAPEMHRECGGFIARQGIDLLMGTGALTEHTLRAADAAGMERCCHYQTMEELTEQLIRAMRPKDVIWFKASHGMGLEEVITTVLGKEEKA